MTVFPKADVQNVRLGIELNVRLWPKAAAGERACRGECGAVDQAPLTPRSKKTTGEAEVEEARQRGVDHCRRPTT